MKIQTEALQKNKKNIAPGPKGNFITGSLREMAVNPILLLSKGAENYGNIVKFRFLNISAFLITNPNHIKYVLIENYSNYRKAFTYDKLKPLLGKGLLTSEGELWKKQRRLIQPMFRPKQILPFIQTMNHFTDKFIEKWSCMGDKAEINISAEMMSLTLNIAIKAMMTTDISKEASEVREAFTFALEFINYKMTAVLSLPEFVPTKANRQYKKSMKILEEIVARIIKNRHGSEHKYSDLLSIMLLARNEENQRAMDDSQIRDEIMTFILAGHETTAHTLTWTFYLLSKYTEIKEKVKNELKTVLKNREANFEDLKNLKYLNMVIQEVMRLYPPLWIIERENNEDDEIGGYFIPKDSLIMISPYITHRLSELWEEPEKFDPDRFLPENSEKRSKYAYLPFGTGHRQCIGNHFAMTEAMIVLAKILQKFDFEFVSDTLPEIESVITLRPKNGIKLRVNY